MKPIFVKGTAIGMMVSIGAAICGAPFMAQFIFSCAATMAFIWIANNEHDE